MNRPWRLIGLPLALAALWWVARLGSVKLAMTIGITLLLLGLFMYATRKRPGRRYEGTPSGRAEAELQTWNWGGAGDGGGGGGGDGGGG